MKKILLFISPLLLSMYVHAQNSIPNYGMESWVNSTGFYEEPVNWGTLNFLGLTQYGGNPITCFKDSLTQHSGNYCVRVESVALTANPASGSIPDTLGYIWTGAVNLISQTATFGYAQSARPLNFNWWSKYSPMNAGDSGYVIVALTHWNGLSTDTLAYAGSVIYNTPSWTQFNTTFFYNPLYPNTIFPDTAIIVCSATDDHFPRPGSKLWMDDMSFTGWVGVNEFSGNDYSVSVFPNPSSTTTNFEINNPDAAEIAIYDLQGRELKRENISGNKVSIDTHSFSPGIYSYRIFTKENSVFHMGKFSVAE